MTRFFGAPTIALVFLGAALTPPAHADLIVSLVGMAICVRRRNAIAICPERKNEHGIA